jgi:hypothetical protein
VKLEVSGNLGSNYPSWCAVAGFEGWRVAFCIMSFTAVCIGMLVITLASDPSQSAARRQQSGYERLASSKTSLSVKTKQIEGDASAGKKGHLVNGPYRSGELPLDCGCAIRRQLPDQFRRALMLSSFRPHCNYSARFLAPRISPSIIAGESLVSSCSRNATLALTTFSMTFIS